MPVISQEGRATSEAAAARDPEASEAEDALENLLDGGLYGLAEQTGGQRRGFLRAPAVLLLLAALVGAACTVRCLAARAPAGGAALAPLRALPDSSQDTALAPLRALPDSHKVDPAVQEDQARLAVVHTTLHPFVRLDEVHQRAEAAPTAALATGKPLQPLQRTTHAIAG